MLVALAAVAIDCRRLRRPPPNEPALCMEGTWPPCWKPVPPPGWGGEPFIVEREVGCRSLATVAQARNKRCQMV